MGIGKTAATNSGPTYKALLNDSTNHRGKHPIEIIDSEIIRLSRRLYGKGVVLNEFENNGVASAHQRTLQRAERK